MKLNNKRPNCSFSINDELRPAIAEFAPRGPISCGLVNGSQYRRRFAF